MDVKEILEKRNIQYKTRGRDYQVRCLNPEHEDTHPSMNIDKISGVFNCLSCGYAGDLYKYFKINKEKYIDQKAEEVAKKIKALINNKPLALPLDAIPFREAYRNIKPETYRKFGAFTTKSQEIHMEGRIVFPIFDINGQIKVFQGRYQYSDLDPRYKNHPKEMQLPLYPQTLNIINNSIILVEGFFDMLNLHDKGLTNTVCVFGTAFGNVKKVSKQKKNIERLLLYKYQGADKVYIMFDGDYSGKDAAENLQKYLSSTFITEIIEMEEGKDPGKLTESQVIKLKEDLYA
jgi:DNA primase